MISPKKPAEIPNSIWKPLNTKNKSTMKAVYPVISPTIKNNLTESLVKIVEETSNRIVLDMVKNNSLETMLCDTLSENIVNGWNIHTNSVVVFKKSINKPLYFNSDKKNVIESMIKLINDLEVAERKEMIGFNFWVKKRGQVNDLIKQLQQFNDRTIDKFS